MRFSAGSVSLELFKLAQSRNAPVGSVFSLTVSVGLEIKGKIEPTINDERDERN